MVEEKVRDFSIKLIFNFSGLQEVKDLQIEPKYQCNLMTYRTTNPRVLQSSFKLLFI